MLDIISGLLTPTEGQVLFDGDDVTRRPTVERNIAQVFQFPVLYDTMTVEQNMRFPLRNRGIDKREAQHRAEEVADLLDIAHLLKRRAKGLSADAKQLVSLARALVRRDVSAILFDEPLTVIDPQRKWTLRQALKRVHAELNHTLVYVTHDQTEALTFADTVVVMDEGEVLQRGTPDELFERPAHVFVGNFIGSPGMNFLACTVQDGVVSVAGVDLIRLPDAESTDQGPDDVVGIRPDFVRCVPPDEIRPGDIEATVGIVRDLGTAHLVELRLGAEPTGEATDQAPERAPASRASALVARIPAGGHVPDERCGIRLDPADVHLFRGGRRVPGCLPTGSDVEAAR
jgi:glycerol transport system ATP-binding protein